MICSYTLIGGHPISSAQIMNPTTKNSSLGFTAMGGGLETYKSLGDVFGIQAAVDSMKTAAYANQETVSSSSTASNMNGTHSINDLPQTMHMNNMNDGEKRSNGGN